MGFFLGSVLVLVLTLILVGAMYRWVEKNHPPKEKRDDND